VKLRFVIAAGEVVVRGAACAGEQGWGVAVNATKLVEPGLRHFDDRPSLYRRPVINLTVIE
jgi:hypothetical protein